MLTVLISVCAAVVIYSTGVILFGDSPKKRIKKRIGELAQDVETAYIHDAVINEKKKNKNKKKKTENRFVSKRLADSLALSGIKLNASEYMILWITLTVGPVILGSLLNLDVVAIMALCIIGFAIPPIMVQRSKLKHQQLFNKQLGDALTIMSNCMRSGYSFQQAMSSIANEMQAPIATEFARVVREMNYGVSMENTLNNMVKRVNNKDLGLLVSAVLTSAQVGANLSDILDTISETVRDRIRLREEIRTLSAQGRMSGMIIGLLPVVVILFLMVTNPSYFADFAAHPVGRVMIIASVFMELTGFLIINKIVDIKY